MCWKEIKGCRTRRRAECWQLTLICRFIVMQNSVMKYMTRMGQKTGTLNTSKNVQIIAIVVDFVMAYQNLNSGSRRMNGLNSSLLLVGNAGPSGSSAKIEWWCWWSAGASSKMAFKSYPNPNPATDRFSVLRRRWTGWDDKCRVHTLQCTTLGL